jgi:uncharacterized protein
VEATDLLAHGVGPLVLLAVMLFLAGCLGGATGLGFANLASASLALLLDARIAVILLAAITPIVMLMPVVRYRAKLPEARQRLGGMYAAMPLGILIGSYLLVSLPVPAIALALGILTMISVAVAFRGFRLPPAGHLERIGSPTIGLVCGAANSAVGVSGPILGMYLLALDLNKTLFAFVTASMFASMGALRLVTLAALGQLSFTTIGISLALCVPSLLGIRTGFLLQHRIDQRAFNWLVLGILFVTGLLLVWRGFSGLMH